MNKIIINFAIASCFALGATFAHAGDKGSASTSNAAAQQTKINYYELYDEHGKPKTAISGVEGVVHSSEPMKNEYRGQEFDYRDPHMTLIGS